MDIIGNIVDLMIETKIVSGKNDARRVIEQGGCYLNNAKITDPCFMVPASELLHGKYLILRRGKRTIGAVIYDG